MDTKSVSKALGIRDIGIINVSLYKPSQKGEVGIFNSHYGVPQSDHQKRVAKEYMLNYNPMFKKETRNKMLGNTNGANRSTEGRLQSTNHITQLNSTLKTCVNCGTQVYNHGVFSRWHGDRCRREAI